MSIAQGGLELYREYPPADESKSIAEVLRDGDAILRLSGRPVLRGQHAKGTGGVHAKLYVDPERPEETRAGIFAEATTFDAIVRFSNGKGRIQSDLQRDARGMAIKVLGVTGERAVPGEADTTTQDFVMINHPVFPFRNAAQYAKFTKLKRQLMGAIGPLGNDLAQLLYLGVPGRIRQLIIGVKLKLHKVTNPLASQYWSMSAYRLGERAVKFTAKPQWINFDAPPGAGVGAKDTFDLLGRALADHLRERKAVFDLMVQFQTDPVAMPIEDPTVEWDEAVSPPVKVATLVIEKTDLDSAEAMAFHKKCEAMSFSPWHSLVEHQPLGGINRLRKAVYESNARMRAERATAAAGGAAEGVGGRSTARDGLSNRLQGYLLTHFGWFWRLVGKIEPLSRLVNAKLVNNAIYKTSTRPYAFSTMSAYTSWDSLTDLKFSGRHLPEATTGTAGQPPVDELVKLFRRDKGTILSDKSTLMFPYFAQWFTDGFLRTDRADWRKNTSNHEIDLSQLYGLNPSITQLIRTHERGMLKSQIVSGEEYPPYYFEGDVEKPEFKGAKPHFPEGLPPERRATLFVMGGDRANVNIGYAMMNVLFLREHNRICGALAKAYEGWNDERLFQTTRNILIVVLLRIVIEEYINHITPYFYKFRLIPDSSPNEHWRRQNWMSVEFNLLYRWHGLVPDTVEFPGLSLPAIDGSFNNALITDRGLGASFEAASRQAAGRIGMRNTPDFLLGTEKASIELGRYVRLRSYNDYREACKYPRVTDFDQITGDPEVLAGLKSLHRHVDDIEFYTGLFAEDVREHSAVGPMIGRLVGVDAFSQALTNPLLSHNVFNKETFSQVGWEILHETKRLGQILQRNVPAGSGPFRVSLTREGAEVG